MHGLSLHNLALDFSDCWQSCAQASKQFSIKSIAAAMDANSEEYATKVWCSNNRALWFLIWLGLLCLRSNVPEVITGSSATTKTVHIATCTAQQSWTRCIRFRTRKLRKRKRPFTSGVTIGSPGAITGSSISICHVRLHRRNTCEPCIGFAQMRLKSRS